jgi:Zn-dependent protease
MRAKRLLESGGHMTLQQVDMLFQLIVFLFAISVHESAHAWMANRCGDPTARMLGRITLNPIKHSDPIGTILLPGIALYASHVTGHNIPVIGWAKPTPVDPRNFKSPVLDDIKTSVVGPISNFVVATAATLALGFIMLASPAGRLSVQALLQGFALTNSSLAPLIVLMYDLLVINVLLAVFNLIPVPPLDGSHVLRHFLSEPVRRAYDAVGWVGLIVLVYLGGGLLMDLISPVIRLYTSVLKRL